MITEPNTTPAQPQATETAARAAWQAKLKARTKAKAKAQVKAQAPAPRPPAWLSTEGREHFAATLKLIRADVDTKPVDGDVLGLYCESLCRYIRLRDEAAQAPRFHITPGGERLHPVHRALSEAVSELSKLALSLGMAPQARKNLQAPTPEKAKPGGTGPDVGRGFAT